MSKPNFKNHTIWTGDNLDTIDQMALLAEKMTGSHNKERRA